MKGYPTEHVPKRQWSCLWQWLLVTYMQPTFSVDRMYVTRWLCLTPVAACAKSKGNKLKSFLQTMPRH